VKTTIEVPDARFRRAKSVAAQRGIPLRAQVSETLTEKLRALHKETLRINKIIEQEFGQIEPEDLE
jgi:hypothetical protein